MGKKYIEFTPEDLKKIEHMAGLGLNLNQISHVMGISETTLDRRIAKDPEIKGAILRGRSVASYAVRNTAYKLAVSGTCYAMTIFWLKCREGFMDKQVHEVIHHNADKADNIKTLIEALSYNDRPYIAPTTDGNSANQEPALEVRAH